MRTLAEIVEKMKARIAAIDNIIATFQTTMDNANKTMDEMKVSLAKANTTIDNANKMIVTLQTDYTSLKKEIEEHINKKPWWPF